MLGRYLIAIILNAILLALSVVSGHAQPACLTTAPNAVACQQNGTNLQPSDIVLGQQSVGPSRNNQTVNFTLTQLMSAGMPASFATLAASGATTLSSTLTVTGATTLSSTLAVGGATTLQGAATITGNTSIGGTLGAGATTITGTLAASGNSTVGGTLGVTGAVTAPSISSSGPSFLIANNGATTSFGGVAVMKAITTGSLPGSATQGSLVWSPDCRNGSESIGAGTGCFSYSNDNGTWVQLSNPSTLQINVAGQSVFLGGTVSGQGNGSRILTSTGTFTPGNAIVTSANGTAIDGGAPPGGGGGGGGTVGNCGSAPAVAYYSVAGTAVTCLSQLASAVLVTNGASTPSFATTLPSALTIPSPTVSSPSITGLATVASETLTGALTTAASVAGGANFFCPQGTAPTSPTNGSIWCTTQGMFGRFNGFTLGPFASLTSFSATSPLSYNSGTGAFTCPTCLTSGSGGALTTSSPLSITGNNLALGTAIQTATLWWPANVSVTNDVAPIPNETWPWATGTIDSITYHTSGTSTPSFVVGVQINGVPVTGCTNITVSSSSDTTSTCTAANAVTSGQHVTAVTSGVSGSPFSSVVQVNFHRSFP
jgi:fibronectin-binding autotransporter adhesin